MHPNIDIVDYSYLGCMDSMDCMRICNLDCMDDMDCRPDISDPDCLDYLDGSDYMDYNLNQCNFKSDCQWTERTTLRLWMD